MRIAIQSQHNDEHFHLRHQALWFILFLLALMLVLSKTVSAGSSIVDRPASSVRGGYEFLAARLPQVLYRLEPRPTSPAKVDGYVAVSELPVAFGDQRSHTT